MKYVVTILLLGLLSACGGASDNSEPPAKLVKFDQTARMKIIEDVDIGVAANNYIRLKPLVMDKTVLVADNTGYMVAIDTEHSSISWQKQLDVVYPSDLGGDESLYLFGTRGGEVVALDPATGNIIWKVAVSSEVLAKPVLAEGIVIVKTVDGLITGLDVRDGKQLWIYKRDVPALTVRGNSTPLIHQGAIITGLDNGRLVILELKTGKLKWEKIITLPQGRSDTDRLVDLDADIIVQNNIAYIAGYQGRLVALDLTTGEFAWLRKMSAVNNMVLENNKLYITDARSHVWALDAQSGATIWKQEAFTSRNLTSPVLMGEYIVLADSRGYVHVIAKSDGHHVSRILVDESPIDIKPVIAGHQIGVITQSAKYFVLGFKPQGL